MTGDFVSRGLGAGLKRRLDRWISLEVLPAIGEGCWPTGGVRFAMADAGVAGLMIESADRPGRGFPLVVLVGLGSGASLPACDAWADRVLPLAEAAAAGELDPSELAAALGEVTPPEHDDDETEPGSRIWARGAAPVAAVSELFAERPDG